APSGADGWQVVDVVLHLAQSEEAVVASATGPSEAGTWAPRAAAGETGAGRDGGETGTLDEVMDRLVRAQRAAPDVVFRRWRTAGPERAALRYGPPDAESTIAGPAGAFCRVGARRLPAEESGLITSGPHGATALRVLRNYAA